MSNNKINLEFYEHMVEKLKNVKTYEDNYTLCQNAAYAIETLIKPDALKQED